MKKASPYYSPDLKIKDPRFSIDDLQDYSLLLQAGEREFQLAVIDTKSNRCLLLEHYNLFDFSSEEEHQRLIENLFEDHHLLMAGFWHSVRFSVKNLRFSLIPAALFDKEQSAAYLRLTSPLPATDSILYYRHLKNSIITVFGAEQRFMEWLSRRYPNLKIQVIHHISAFTEGVLHSSDHSSGQDVFLLLENGLLSVLITQGNKLQYANLFRCQEPADFLRYLMMVLKQFGLDQTSTKIQLWGNVPPDSPWFRAVKPYLGNLSFGSRPPFLSFHYMFDEAADQRFFDLFSLYLCE
ncbi:DUF3822 family protein [Cesiribacter andamanensis]|uniref:DUF3822 domain-containing protein n=1 Tax=Cesiribacter andamanensis AMV16 TaxID=1279009 RepID=M7N5Y3_9BACT|nr:DUF3822 family protein [Cesiribacter andamanensis]EMR02692.1 hypothetical protein ADICEAN_02169 [Cesiribacter andamanensis AMV16]